MKSKIPVGNMHLLILSYLIWSMMSVRCAPADGISYKDIQKLGASCFSMDNCQSPRSYDDLKDFNCHCGEFCAEYNTCCVDSPFRLASPPVSENRIQCNKLYSSINHYYMIDSCDPDWSGDDTIELLCLSNGEELSDPTLLIPVTNTATGITYKNYFCSVCNGNNGDQSLVFWEAEVSSFLRAIPNSPLELLTFDRIKNVWVIDETRVPWNPPDEAAWNSATEALWNPVNGTAGSAWHPVNRADRNEPIQSNFIVSFEVHYPLRIQKTVRSCRNVIFECDPSWEDDDIRRKCSAYMAIITIDEHFPFPSYRNAHCALCNFERLDNVRCSVRRIFTQIKPVRSFSVLIDVNTSNGNLVGKKERCNEGSIYDPYFDKCRVLKCALPGHSIQNGKCAKT